MAPRSWQTMAFVGVSLDGYIARPNGDISWLTNPPEDHRHATGFAGTTSPPPYDEFMAGIDHVVMGRRTLETVLGFGYWPYPNRRTIVLSTTLPLDVHPQVTVARELSEALMFLEAGDAGGVYVDGGGVFRTFLNAGLLDEIIITHAPILLGGGYQLFGPLEREISLTHLGSSVVELGRVASRYGVNSPGAPGGD